MCSYNFMAAQITGPKMCADTCKLTNTLTPAEAEDEQHQYDLMLQCCEPCNLEVHEDSFSQKPSKWHQQKIGGQP